MGLPEAGRPADGAAVRRAVGTPLLLLGVLLPFLPLLVWSISATWRYPALVPQRLAGRGWGVVADPGSAVLPGLITSTAVGLAVAVTAGAVGLATGRALARYRFPGRGLAVLVLLGPVVVPTIATSLGLQVVFLRLGLAGTAAGVVVAHLMPAVPYVSLVVAAAHARLDPDLEHQARVLGATPARVLREVTWPALRPALQVGMMVAFLISWNEYVLTLLIGGGRVQTLPLLLFSAVGSSDTSVAAALALLVSLPPLAVVALVSRTVGASRTPAPDLARPA